MDLRDRPAFSLEQYSKVLSLLNGDGLPYILVGGQAVNYWAGHYLSVEPALQDLLPFTSEDIDFKGDRKDVERLATQLNLKPSYPRSVEMTILAGSIPFKVDGNISNIEFITKIPGVSGSVESMAIEAVASGQRIRVLDPISLFECKLKLAATVDQKGRQDAHHLKIMILCVRSFLRQVLDSVNTNESPVKGWLGATTRIMKLTTFTHASKAARLYAIKWFEILPHREIAESQNASIIQFREKQLPKWKPD